MPDNKNTENFVVTARKWRPLRFDDIVGQEHITTTLKNAISAERLHHAYLFCGPRGVGKTTAARIYARAVNCENIKNNEPCNVCESCRNVLDSRSMDIIEIDGASNNSVEDVRKLRENAKYPPANGKYKMYIIDEVHMLSTSAFNALLKTLEEPPPHLLFVFATTESHKVPATIISRCQRFDFKRIEVENIINRLKHISNSEDIEIDEESLLNIAKKADGSMRDSQSIFDQVVAFCGKSIVYKDMAEALHLIDNDFYFNLTDAISSQNVNSIFDLSSEVISKGYDLLECMNGLLEHFRNILTVNVTGNTDLLDCHESYYPKYLDAGKSFSKADILRYVNYILSQEQGLKYSIQPRVRFELILSHLASMGKSIEIKEILSKLNNLSKEGDIRDNLEEKKSIDEKSKAVYKAKTDLIARETQKEYKKQTENASDQNDESQKISKGISAQELSVRWNDFLLENASGENGLSTFKSQNVEFEDSKIIVCPNNQFIYENLLLKKQQLISALLDFFECRIEIIINPVKQNLETNINEVSSGNDDNKSNSDDHSSKELHDAEKFIIENFKAREE